MIFKWKDRTLRSALKNKEVLHFLYNGRPRIVEPQCYGISTADRPVLRGYQIAGKSSSKLPALKLFDVEKIENLKTTKKHFLGPHKPYNPNDKAMKVIFASLKKK
jgi:hypothetical protein